MKTQWNGDQALYQLPDRYQTSYSDLASPGFQAEAVIQNLQPDEAIVVRPGESAVPISFNISNPSSIVDSFTLSVIGVPAEWLQIEPSGQRPIRLLPGQTQAVSLLLKPPRSPESRSGQYQLYIQAFSQNVPQQVAVREKIITVAKFRAFTCALRPVREDGVRLGRYEVILTNEGNAGLAIDLSAHQEVRRCQLLITPPEVIVPAGQRRTVDLTVRAKNRLSGGEEAFHTFAITATPEFGEAQTVEGTWKQIQPAFDLSVLPQKRETVGQGQFEVAIKNQSEVELLLALKGQDEEAACDYRFVPSDVIVSPEDRVNTQLTVRPIDRLRRTEPKSYPFVITAYLANSPDIYQQTQAEWIQLPRSFKWLSGGQVLLRLLAALIFLIGTYLLLAYVPPIPQIEVRANPTFAVEGELGQYRITYSIRPGEAARIDEKVIENLMDQVRSLQIGIGDQTLKAEMTVNDQIIPLQSLTGAITITIDAPPAIRIDAVDRKAVASEAILIPVHTPTPTLTPTPTATPAQPCSPSLMLIQSVPLHEGHSSDYAQRGTLANGTRLELIGHNGGWFRVHSDQLGVGWVKKESGRVACPEATLPIVVTSPPTPTIAPTVTPTEPAPTPTPTAFVNFSITERVISTDNQGVTKVCNELNWDTGNIDQIYISGIFDTADLIPKPGEPHLYMINGIGSLLDCVPPNHSDIYYLHVFLKDGKRCQVSITQGFIPPSFCK